MWQDFQRWDTTSSSTLSYSLRARCRGWWRATRKAVVGAGKWCSRFRGLCGQFCASSRLEVMLEAAPTSRAESPREIGQGTGSGPRGAATGAAR